MPWKDLASELAEEFGQIRLDRRSLEGFQHIAPIDKEARRNYNRWYSKQVRYPKHKERILLLKRQFHIYHKTLQDECWLRTKERWARKVKARSTHGTKQHETWLEYLRRWRKHRYHTDPEFRAKVLESARLYRLRKGQTPRKRVTTEEQREKMRAYKKEYSRRMRQDPEYREKQRLYMKAHNKKRQQDPNYRAQQNERRRLNRGKETSGRTGK